MKILKIQAQDLFSYETLDLPLDDVGLVSIEGINHDDGGSNGSGKTSIYKVLTWTIYGDPLSKVLADEVIRTDTETREPVVGKTYGCVHLEVDGKEVTIYRYRKHAECANKIRLYINGIDRTASTDKETQKLIDQILQMDKTTFLSVAMFPQNAKGFASCSDAEQKAIFEKVLCLERFTEALERVKQRVKDMSVLRDTADLQLQDLLKQIQQSTDRIQDLETNEHNFQITKQQSLELIANKLTAHEATRPVIDQTLVENKTKLEGRAAERSRIEAIVSKATKMASDTRSRWSEQTGKIAVYQSQLKDLPPEPSKPEFESNHYNRVFEQANKSHANAQAAKREVVAKLERCRNLLQVREATKECQNCGQTLTESAKMKLFGDIESNIPILELALTSHDGEIAAHVLAAESTERMRQEAVAWEQWKRLMDASEKTREAIAGLEKSSEEAKVEATRLEGVRSKALEALSNVANVQDELGQVKAQIAQQEASLKLWTMELVGIQREDKTMRDRTSPFGGLLEKERTLNSTLVETHQTKQAEYADLNDKLQYDEFWLRGFSRSGVVSLLLDQITPELNHRANEYLDVLTGGKAWVEFATKTTLANGEQREKFSVIVNYDNGAGMYGGISGGEMRRVDIAILLALGDVAASRAHAPVRFRLFDEPFDNLDALGKERVVALLQEKIVPKVGTLLVMSHDEELKSMFDQRIVVEKHNGVSSLRALEVSA